MQFVETHLGFSTADAEDVEVRFANEDLSLSFRDWKEQPQAITFRDCLAFLWQEFDGDSSSSDPPAKQPLGGLRDDATYEVRDSPWLLRQAELRAVPVEAYVHYKLCFNTCGVLDVLARRPSEKL